MLIRIHRTIAATAACLTATIGGVVPAVVSPVALVLVIARIPRGDDSSASS